MTVISGIVSAISGSEAAEEAADAQADATVQAMKIYKEMFEETREDLRPFLDAELARIPYTQKALEEYDKAISKGIGKFEDSPYYKTLMGSIDMMTKAAAKQGAASGVGGGAVQKSLLEPAMTLAGQMRQGWTNEWLNTKINPLAAQAMIGQTPYQQSVLGSAQTGMSAAQTLAGMQQQLGEAAASGYLGRGAAIQSALQPIQSAGAIIGAGMVGKALKLW